MAGPSAVPIPVQTPLAALHYRRCLRTRSADAGQQSSSGIPDTVSHQRIIHRSVAHSRRTSTSGSSTSLTSGARESPSSDATQDQRAAGRHRERLGRWLSGRRQIQSPAARQRSRPDAIAADVPGGGNSPRRRDACWIFAAASQRSVRWICVSPSRDHTCV